MLSPSRAKTILQLGLGLHVQQKKWSGHGRTGRTADDGLTARATKSRRRLSSTLTPVWTRLKAPLLDRVAKKYKRGC